MSETELATFQSQAKPDDTLRKIYYDPETGLLGAAKLYKKARELGIKVTQKQVKEFLERQNVAQQHKQIKREKHFLPFKSPARNYILQADLMFMDPALKTLNGGCYIILCVIDIFSRFAWCVALKNKEAGSVLLAMKPIIEEAKPTVVQFDGGSEFINRSMKSYLAQQNVKVEYNEPGDHNANAIVERFNKTLRGYLEKYCTAFKTKSWFPILGKVVHNYNNSYHSGLKGIPATVCDQKVADTIEINRVNAEAKALTYLKTLNIGDQVRVIKNPVMFAKGALPKFSVTLYTVIDTDGRIKYKLNNDKVYRIYDLLPATVVEEAPVIPDVEEPVVELRQKAKVRRRLNKEGLQGSEKNIREGLRERKPANQLLTKHGERILW